MTGPLRLSTTEILRVAKARFIQLSSQHLIDPSTLDHFFDAGRFGISGEEIKDVELVLLLLAAAHKYGNQKQLKQARSFLNLCEFLSSSTGNSVQRLVHYFTKSLRERIDRETASATPGDFETEKAVDPQTSEILNPALIACSLLIPYCQVMQFASIQAVMEGLTMAKRVHFIDLAIRSGGHCTVLMQALANRREFEHLKITAVGTEMRPKLEEVGESLACFAKTLNVPFSFRTAMVGDMKDLKEDMFELGDDEVVAIYFPLILRNIKARPADCLESLIQVLKNLNPCVVVIIEQETNHNSSDFKERFLDALFFYGAYFDCLDDCINRSDPGRMTMEAFLGREIRDAVAVEEKDRAFCHMKMVEWRDCLAKFDMVENELSMPSIYHAHLVLKNFASGKPCTLDRDADCLITAWKGTPILSVSSWKFHLQQLEQSTKSCITRNSKSS